MRLPEPLTTDEADLFEIWSAATADNGRYFSYLSLPIDTPWEVFRAFYDDERGSVDLARVIADFDRWDSNGQVTLPRLHPLARNINILRACWEIESLKGDFFVFINLPRDTSFIAFASHYGDGQDMARFHEDYVAYPSNSEAVARHVMDLRAPGERIH